MRCMQIQPMLEPYSAGDLSGSRRRSVSAHVHACDSCRNHLKWLGELATRLRSGLSEPDRARLRAKIGRRRRETYSWIGWAMAAGAALLLVAFLFAGGEPAVETADYRLTGTFDRSDSATGPWSRLQNEIPSPGMHLRAVGRDGVILYRDETELKPRAGAVLTLGSREDVIAHLRSGHVRVRFPDASTARILHPAGEVRAVAESGTTSFECEVQPRKGESMQAIRVLVTLTVLTGSVDFVFEGRNTTVSAGETIARTNGNEVEKLLTKFENAVRSGDSASVHRIAEQVFAFGEDAREPVQDWAGNVLRDRETKLRVAHEDLDMLYKKFMDMERRGDVTPELRREFEKITNEKKADVQRYQVEMDAVQGLQSELGLRLSWKAGRVKRDTIDHLMRSLEHFAAKKSWRTAAGCLASGKVSEVKKLVRDLQNIRKDAGQKSGWAAWQLRMKGRDHGPVAVLSTKLNSAGRAFTTANWMEDGTIELINGIAIVDLKKTADGYEIESLISGNVFDPKR